ncbi:TonB-dependent receptor [Phenylobacterium sp. Root700]|uniref:TonB-dependent receptor n=1 Tax=Phenylobacterium sp. Root700 TaxID=1736591 RepID=UPI0009E9C714|nr:TonB-dependent receptor [Phenylobacterium sp. Root700]
MTTLISTRQRTRLLGATALGSALLIAAGGGTAWAQGTASGGPAVEELVVTALKRSTVLQDTPIAISAVTGETLAKMGVDNIGDYAKAVPGLTLVDGGPGARRVVIRGIQGAGEAQVGIYYDETPVGGSPGTTSDSGARSPDLKLFDVQQVEVLRGPQGTLYGSGSMGGTVRVIFRKPGYENEGAFEGNVFSTNGGGMGYEANAMVNLPLVEDKLAARAVVFYREVDGYVDNNVLGLKNLNDETTWAGRLLVRYEPTENLTIDAAAFVQRTDAVAQSVSVKSGDYVSTSRAQLPLYDDYNIYSLTARWDLGWAALTGVTSKYSRSQLQTSDVSNFIGNFRNNPGLCASRNGGVPCGPAEFATFNAYVNTHTPSTLHQPQDVDTWTNELRLSSTAEGPLNWTVGLFSEDRDAFIVSQQQGVDPVTGIAYSPARISTVRTIDDSLKQTAAFGEGSYEITDKLTLTAGARYFKYEKKIVGQTFVGLDLIGARVTPPTTVSSKEDGWVFKFNASYDVNDDIMVYAQASEGFRPGGANQVIGLPGALTPYDSDSLVNYELGAKTAWWSNRLTLNFDVYQIDWDNMQVSGRTANGAFSFISNAGAARVKGAEIEAVLNPMQGLQLQANANFSDAKLVEDQVNPDVNAPGRKGDRIPFIPKVTTGLAAQYTWPLTDGLDGLARLDANYVGTSYSEFRPTNAFRQKVSSYTLANVRVGVEAKDWGAYVYVNNITDELAYVTKNQSAISAGTINGVTVRPRTVGVTFNKKF